MYEAAALKGVEKKIIDKYFTYDGRYHITSEIKRLIRFKHLDLISGENFAHIDIISCRNVVIYFSKDLQKRLYNKFYDALNRDGYFVIGKTETLVGDARYKFRSVNSIAGKVHNEYLKDVYSEEEFSIRNRDVGEMHRIWMGNFGRPGIGIEDQGDHR